MNLSENGEALRNLVKLRGEYIRDSDEGAMHSKPGKTGKGFKTAHGLLLLMLACGEGPRADGGGRVMQANRKQAFRLGGRQCISTAGMWGTLLVAEAKPSLPRGLDV